MKKLDELVDVFAKLPGIGRKSAMRIAFDILDKESYEIDKMINTIKTAHEVIKPCSICTIILDFPNDCKDCPLVKHTLKDNQYLPDGLGKPVKTYYYFVNHLGQTIDYKTLKPYKGKQMKKYAILSLDEAVEILKKINQ